MKRLDRPEPAMLGHSLVTYFLLAIVAAGVGSYLWLARSGDPGFIFQAIGTVLALTLAAEEIVRRDLQRPGDGRTRGDRRRADAAPRPEGPPSGRRVMKRRNRVEPAMPAHSLVTYLLLAIVAAGVGSYLWLARSGDPGFIFQAIGTVLALTLAAEEIVRLEEIARLPGRPASSGSFAQKKGNVGA